MSGGTGGPVLRLGGPMWGGDEDGIPFCEQTELQTDMSENITFLHLLWHTVKTKEKLRMRI